jgi:hypothetical protein
MRVNAWDCVGLLVHSGGGGAPAPKPHLIKVDARRASCSMEEPAGLYARLNGQVHDENFKGALSTCDASAPPPARRCPRPPLPPARNAPSSSGSRWDAFVGCGGTAAAPPTRKGFRDPAAEGREGGGRRCGSHLQEREGAGATQTWDD